MVLVVTGGIGSGKSEVCRIMSGLYHCCVYNADTKAKEMYVRYPELLDKIEEDLGCCLRDENGSLDTALLASLIFNDRRALEAVEDNLFPFLDKDFQEFRKSCAGPVIFESATVLNKPYFSNIGDKVIFVDAPVYLRMERACRRDGASEEMISSRMRNQEINHSRADYIINNDGDFDRLKSQIVEIMNKIL